MHRFDAPDGPYAAGHRGIDLLGRPGQTVRAVDDGKVVYAGRVAGVGVVSLDTAAGRVTYQPVLASVRHGEIVRPGSVVGHLLPTSSHCPPRACLHLGLIVGDEYRDPLPLLGVGPVRLLPLAALGAGAEPAPPSAAGPAVPASVRASDALPPLPLATGASAALSLLVATLG